MYGGWTVKISSAHAWILFFLYSVPASFAVNEDHFVEQQWEIAAWGWAREEKADVETLLEMTASTMLHLLCRIMMSPVTLLWWVDLLSHSSRPFCYCFTAVVIFFPEWISKWLPRKLPARQWLEKIRLTSSSAAICHRGHVRVSQETEHLAAETAMCVRRLGLCHVASFLRVALVSAAIKEKRSLKFLSAANDTDPGPVPLYLEGLTQVEQMLIDWAYLLIVYRKKVVNAAQKSGTQFSSTHPKASSILCPVTSVTCLS